jgi:putative DNA primase/helicase
MTTLGARVMMLSNEMPQLYDSSNAINTRFLILQLSNSFLGKEDVTLLSKLEAELPGIAKWCVEGYKRLKQRGRFSEPETSDAARQEWYEENNPLAQFVEDRCVVGPDEKAEMTALYDIYKTWSEARGFPVMASNQLSRRLSAQLMGKVRKGKSGSTRYMYGLSVSDEI